MLEESTNSFESCQFFTSNQGKRDLVKFVKCTLISRVHMTFYMLSKGYTVPRILGTRDKLSLIRKKQINPVGIGEYSGSLHCFMVLEFTSKVRGQGHLK